jgi:predicted nucleic acid-binding protein
LAQVKAFVDTTVLLAAAMDDHPHHEPSRKLVLSLRSGRDACAAHSLVELYSTLTRMPLPIRRDAVQAMLFVADIQMRVTLFSLTAEEYCTAISEYSSMNITGGAIYDALIAQCALKARAEKIFTWNTRHFRQFGPEVEKRLRLPGE